jgi:hypothetical protein
MARRGRRKTSGGDGDGGSDRDEMAERLVAIHDQT